MQKIMIRVANKPLEESEEAYLDTNVESPFILFNGQPHRLSFRFKDPKADEKAPHLLGYELITFVKARPKTNEEKRADVIKELVEVEAAERKIADRKAELSTKLDQLDVGEAGPVIGEIVKDK